MSESESDDIFTKETRFWVPEGPGTPSREEEEGREEGLNNPDFEEWGPVEESKRQNQEEQGKEKRLKESKSDPKEETRDNPREGEGEGEEGKNPEKERTRL